MKYISRFIFLIIILFFIKIEIIAQIPYYVPKSGLVAWWPFNGNANDESGNGNNGTIDGAQFSKNRFSIDKSAALFDGVDDIISLNSKVGNFDTLDFTISSWVYDSSSINSGGVIVAKRGSFAYGNFFDIDWAGTPAYEMCENGSGLKYIDVIHQEKKFKNNWYHFVFIRSGYNILIYINGVLLMRNTLNFKHNLNNSINATIGGRIFYDNGSSKAELFLGEIDDIGIWNRALTQQEILQLYQSTDYSITNLSWTKIDSGYCFKVIPNLDSTTLFLTRATDVLRSTNNGSTWSPTNWPFPIVRDGRSVTKGGAYSSFNGGMLNVARFDNGWALSVNNGSSYITSGPTGFGTESVNVLALKDGRFLASRGGFLRGIYKSSGTENTTWTNKYPGFDPYDFSRFDDDTIFSCGSYDGGLLLKSTNKGETWISTNYPNYYITDVEVIDDSLFFINSRGELRVSSIANISNSSLKYHFNFPQDVFNYCNYLSDKQLFVMTSLTNGIYLSNNRGISWEKYTLNGVTDYRDATIVKDRIYIATDKGLYVTQLSSSSSNCTISNFNPFANNLVSSSDSLKLDAGTGYSTYQWSNGASQQSIHVKYTGAYKVTVTNASGCTASDSVFVQFPDTVGLHVSTVTAVCNKSIDVPIRVTAFRNMISMQGSINWNAADLRFDSIANYGPSALGLNNTHFSTTNTSNGRLTFSWNDPAGTGQTLADSTTLITLRFTALGTTIRSVPVTVTGTPTPLEFYDASLVKKSSVQTAGAVNITCEFTISGQVLTPADKAVKNVTVTLSGGSSTISAVTDSAGRYSFKILPGTYTLTPAKANEQYKTNGISTIDLVYLQAHILQRTPFSSAYKMIASDGNNSSSVTTADILSIRRLILGTDTTLPNNRLWAFVDGDQTFANVNNAFPFSSTKTLTNQSTDISHTFRGIKIGDINYDRNPLLDQAPSGDTIRLFGEWTDTEDGYATLRVKSRAVNGLLGWQSTLRWDATQLQLQTVNGLVSNLGIGERWKDEGYLTLSWNDPRAEGLNFTEGVSWMELRFKKSSNLKQASLSLTEEKLGTEAFNGNYQSMGLKLEPVMLRGNPWEGQLRIYPNPANRIMNVEWKMEKAGAATVRLLDAQGRVVHIHRGDYGAGVQRVSIRRSSGWSVAGTWMVQVECDGAVRNVPVLLAGD
jgi:Concanavalin A-like lectin/glucanases superfamily/Carboxypeptidase regulatory-like domain/Cohesin domain